MTVIWFYLFTLFRVSTLYTGPVKKITTWGENLFILTSHAIYRDGITVIESDDVLLDFYLSSDTLWVLERHPGTSYTFVSAFDRGFHLLYTRDGVQSARYFEKGDDFALFANDFYAVLEKNNVSTRLYLSRCHVISDSLIAGFNHLSDTFLVLKPSFQYSGLSIDTVLVEYGVSLPRDLKVYENSMYFLTDNNQIYVLTCSDGCNLKRFYPRSNEDFYYVNRAGQSDTQGIWLSAFDKTYLFYEMWNDSIIPVDSIYGVRIKEVAETNSERYMLNYDGTILDNTLREKFHNIGGISLLYQRKDTVFGILGNHPAHAIISNALAFSFNVLDTFKVRYFYMGQEGTYYLLKNGELYDVSRGVSISDSVMQPFLVRDTHLYFIRHDSLLDYNIRERRVERSTTYGGESILFLDSYNEEDILVFTRDTGMQGIFLHRVDSMLNEQSRIVVASNQGFVSLFKPFLYGNIVYVPYAYSVSGEYRIARVNLQGSYVESIFSGDGIPVAITSFSQDSLYILEMPYGASDVRLALADFASGESFVSDFIGTGGGSMLADKNFLIISTDGKVDLFDIRLKRIIRSFPVVPVSNIIKDRQIVLYSLFTGVVYMDISLISSDGSLIFRKNVELYNGYNSISLPDFLTSGIYFLRLRLKDEDQIGTFKLIYVNDRKF